MDRVREVFLELDKSGDGTLSVEEVRDGLVRAMGCVKGNLDDFNRIMADLDKDGNGVVDYSEFLAASINKQTIVDQQNLKIAFEMLDGDRNGQITKDELREAFETQSVKDDEMWNRIIAEVDKNNNGTIDYDEFSEVMNRIVSSQYKNLANVLEVVSIRLKKQFGRKLALSSQLQQGLKKSE